MATRIAQTDLARDALYTKVNQMYDEKVSLTGEETISGAKTFTSNVKVSKATPNVDLYNTNITKGTMPSTLQYAHNAMVDKDGKYIAMTQYQYNTAGETQAVVRAYSPNNENDYAQISIWYPPTGNPYTYAPTPTEDTTNSTQIDTVGARNTKLANYVGLTGNQTIAGTKTFSTSPVIPTPGVSSNTTVPASTAYINNKFKVVSSLPSSPDSNVFYFVKGS